MKKSNAEMLEDVLTRLRVQGGITETNPGSIARMFAEVMIQEFSPFYDQLDLVSAMGFVSSAQGTYLDLVGELLSCFREVGEQDQNYRARIINQVTVAQSANLTALRLKALQVEGVADVQFKRYTHGTGSFTCYVIPQVYPITNNLLIRIEQVLNDTAGFGMGIIVKTSEYKPVDLDINLIFQTKTTPLEREYLRNQVIVNVTGYMKSLNMGNAIIINEIVQRVMETSDQILDMEIKQLRIDEKEYFIKNVEPSSEERFFLRKINIV